MSIKTTATLENYCKHTRHNAAGSYYYIYNTFWQGIFEYSYIKYKQNSGFSSSSRDSPLSLYAAQIRERYISFYYFPPPYFTYQTRVTCISTALLDRVRVLFVVHRWCVMIVGLFEQPLCRVHLIPTLAVCCRFRFFSLPISVFLIPVTNYTCIEIEF